MEYYKRSLFAVKAFLVFIIVMVASTFMFQDKMHSIDNGVEISPEQLQEFLEQQNNNKNVKEEEQVIQIDMPQNEISDNKQFEEQEQNWQETQTNPQYQEQFIPENIPDSQEYIEQKQSENAERNYGEHQPAEQREHFDNQSMHRQREHREHQPAERYNREVEETEISD